MRLILTVVFLAAFALPAWAQSQCVSRNEIVNGMAAKGLTKSERGVARDGASVVQVYRNPETKRWAIVEFYPTGRACIRAQGTGWTAYEGPEV